MNLRDLSAKIHVLGLVGLSGRLCGAPPETRVGADPLIEGCRPYEALVASLCDIRLEVHKPLCFKPGLRTRRGVNIEGGRVPKP